MNHFGQQKKRNGIGPLATSADNMRFAPTPSHRHTHTQQTSQSYKIHIRNRRCFFFYAIVFQSRLSNRICFVFFNKNRPPKLSNRHNQWKPIATFLYTPNSLSANSSLIQQQKPIPSHPQPPVK